MMEYKINKTFFVNTEIINRQIYAISGGLILNSTLCHICLSWMKKFVMDLPWMKTFAMDVIFDITLEF